MSLEMDMHFSDSTAHKPHLQMQCQTLSSSSISVACGELRGSLPKQYSSREVQNSNFPPYLLFPGGTRSWRGWRRCGRTSARASSTGTAAWGARWATGATSTRCSSTRRASRGPRRSSSRRRASGRCESCVESFNMNVTTLKIGAPSAMKVRLRE